MYRPEKFLVEDSEAIETLIKRYSFATLINETEISHLPLLLVGSVKSGVLQGHFARLNSHWKKMMDEPLTTAIFHGPDAYISPRHYSSKEEVPTWNYAVVHIIGSARIMDNSKWLKDFLVRLTEKNENLPRDSWKFDPNSSYIEKMLGGIMGFEIKIEEVTAKFKLSQNKSIEDQIQVKQACLESSNQKVRELGELMKN